jgi:uncharacterized protein YjbI with pentapeptide repeats
MITLKNYLDNSTIYTSTASSLREAVEEAVRNNVNLSFVSLREADLGCINIDGANLYRANLYKCFLYESSLKNVNFREANLGGADLGSTNLEGANLEGANLNGAYILGASLTGTSLKYCDLTDALICTEKLNK